MQRVSSKPAAAPCRGREPTPRIVMKLRLSALLFACAVAAPVFAQKEPAEVTDTEIAKYKVSGETECRVGAAGKGDPADVAAFCSCLFKSLDKTMTRPE